jgi:hypothetical protein
MPTDVDTDRGGQLAGPGASVRFAVVSRSVPSSKVKSPCRLQFRQAEARCEPRCVIAPSAFSHTRAITPLTGVKRLCAQTGRSPPSGRAGEPVSREGRPTRGRRRSETPREEYYLKRRDERVRLRV